ncbi:MAG: signal recognition particle protein [Planctomycetota bacterium]
MFDALSDKFDVAMRKLSGRGKISEANVREAMDDVRTALLEADVQYEVAQHFCDRCIDQALGQEVLASLKPGEQMIKVVHDELARLLGGDQALGPDGQPAPEAPLYFVSPGPTVIMLSGLQGSGKTTTCGKLAGYLKKHGKSVMLCAADLQRPAAVTQLQVLAEQVQAEAPGPGQVTFHGEPDKVAEYGKAVGAAVTVCRNAVERARTDKTDVLILDTAGRLHLNDELMDELRKVQAAVQPHHIFLVLDSMTGQDAVLSAKAFNDQLELDGVILSKFDSDTRGGAALSVRHVTGKPIKFVGTGEKLDALEPFHADRAAGRILGMGDIVSLVEKAQEEVSEEEALRLQEKMAAGKLTMDDFLGQLRKMRKMGSMKSLLGLMPGIGKQLKDLPLDEKEIDRTEAIIQSMTHHERRDVDVLDNSRRRRIATGAGVDQKAVSQLVKGFDMVSSMSQQLSGMGAMGKLKAMTQMGQMDPAAMMGMGGGFGPRAKGSTKASANKPQYKKRKKR